MSKITCTLAFIAGAAAGSFITWKVVKDRYEQLAQEDFDARRYKKTPDETSEQPQEETEDEDMEEYGSSLEENGYTTTVEEEPTPVKTIPGEIPYVIAPEEFGDLPDYDTIELTYYADGVLADDNDEIVDDVDEIVGSDSLETFGQYEDDSVYVRNDRLKADYEILLDHREYWGYRKTKSPHRTEE